MPATFLDFAFWQIDENPTPDATCDSVFGLEEASHDV